MMIDPPIGSETCYCLPCGRLLLHSKNAPNVSANNSHASDLPRAPGVDPAIEESFSKELFQESFLGPCDQVLWGSLGIWGREVQISNPHDSESMAKPMTDSV